MNIYLSGNPIVEVINTPLDATSYYWRLIDENETVLIAASAPQSAFGGSDISFPISAGFNTLPLGTVRALRSVEAYFTTPIGIVKLSVDYMVEAEEPLVVNFNTFQTYGESVLNSYDLFDLKGWNAATKIQRISAMIAARRNISQLRFRYVFDAYQNVIDATVGVSDLSIVSKANWDALPAVFKESLKRAQLLEADFLILGGESAFDTKRREGITSETIGDTTVQLRKGKAIEQAVCPRAMKELSKYVLHRIRISRT